MHQTFRVRPNWLITSSALAVVAMVQVVNAQTVPSAPAPPVRSAIDQNGINLATGSLVISTPSIVIGAKGGSSLDFGQTYSGAVWTHPYLVSMQVTSSGAIISMGNSSDTFSLSGTTFTSATGNGATLVSTDSGYVYTLADGAVITFSKMGVTPLSGSIIQTGTPVPVNALLYYGGVVAALPTTMKFPSGEVWTFSFKTQSVSSSLVPGIYTGPPMNIRTANNNILYARLQSVTSSTGLQIKLGYTQSSISSTSATDGSPNSQWSQITQAQAINNGVDYCDPLADTCSGLSTA
jgi:hypothetical protein